MRSKRDGPLSIRLTDGRIIFANPHGWFPAMQDIDGKYAYACEVCPVRGYCEDNNEFDCQVYGMFTGFYCSNNLCHELATPWCIDEALMRTGAILEVPA